MPIYKPTELHQFLEELGVHPKKGLSQNFLIDGNILRKIVSAANVTPGDIVMEVGPGPGSLTEELLNSGAKVIAVEKDDVFAKALERLKSEENKLEVHCDDILTFPVEQALKPYLEQGKKAKVIANLPYHLTTPIIAQFIEQRHLFSTLVFMVQDEVARRFVAKPKTKDYGSFTIFLNFYTQPTYAFTVSRQCFYPSPKVDSAVVVLELRKPPHVSNEEAFFVLTRTSFKQRRKMMRSSMRDIYAPALMEASLAQIGQNPLARPEELSLDDFIKLFEILYQTTKKTT
ncbi:MAG TPA: 16S rRNA (adenine(1518)-N(6)/adenine(1519)-N(6))-dimethyltransferase RsmA [Parachlamydiaceae bacterium]|nr:16S rRNA (adenine(1518)-N(6)/adenine(1519)-N(6))-dimethyltransferase RsmA [Parachlamydiaceae bacterium]